VKRHCSATRRPTGDGMRLIVSDHVRLRFPAYRAIVVEASGVRNGPSDGDSAGLLREAEARARRRLGDGPPSALPEIAAWRAAMSAFGCKPSRYPCSAEALLKRVARGDELPAINRLVDLYNAISIAYALPLGGEDVDRVSGDVVLMPAVGGEEFDGGDPPAPGEIVWRDDLGVTCRAWNWRQGVRTRITETSTHVYFLLEAIDQKGALALGQAAEELRTRLDADHIEAVELP
jgi:DNA/RNA-binding domain of Phe-tRNA-synthetase-like protein